MNAHGPLTASGESRCSGGLDGDVHRDPVRRGPSIPARSHRRRGDRHRQSWRMNTSGSRPTPRSREPHRKAPRSPRQSRRHLHRRMSPSAFHRARAQAGPVRKPWAWPSRLQGSNSVPESFHRVLGGDRPLWGRSGVNRPRRDDERARQRLHRSRRLPSGGRSGVHGALLFRLRSRSPLKPGLGSCQRKSGISEIARG